MKRLLILDPAGLLWGSERALLDFIADIPGYEAACCCPPRTPLIDKLNQIDVHSFPYFEADLHLKGRVARLRALLGLMRAIREFRPDIIHVNQAGATRIAVIACKIFRIPCVAHVRLREDVEYLANLRPKADVLRALIAISEPIRALIASKPQLNAIPCRLLLDAYRPGSSSSEMSRVAKKWNFICVGRFSESKGQELLINAIAAIGDQNPRTSVAFVGGTNPHAEHLQKLVQRLRLADRVTFLGHRDDVGALIRQADWLVCPSEYEPLGRVIFEAWDYGIPVIAGKFSGGAARSVSACHGGLLYEKWLADSLAITMKEALHTDENNRRAMVDSGRTWIRKQTDPERYARVMAEVFDSSLSKRK